MQGYSVAQLKAAIQQGEMTIAELQKHIAIMYEELKKCQDGPEGCKLIVSVASIEAAKADAVTLCLPEDAVADGTEAKLSDLIINDPKEFTLKATTVSESFNDLAVTVTVDEMSTDVELSAAKKIKKPGLQQDGAEAVAEFEGSTAKVTFIVIPLGARDARMAEITAQLQQLSKMKDTYMKELQRLRAAEASASQHRGRQQAERKDAAQSPAGDGILGKAAFVGTIAWHMRGYALFAAAVALLSTRGDYLAM